MTFRDDEKSSTDVTHLHLYSWRFHVCLLKSLAAAAHFMPQDLRTEKKVSKNFNKIKIYDETSSSHAHIYISHIEENEFPERRRRR